MNIDNTTILYFSPVAWNHNWQRQQVFATDFAKTNQVVYVLPIGAFNRSIFSIVKRVFFHTKMAREGIGSQRYQAPKNLFILSIKFIPWHNNKLVEKINAWLILRQLHAFIRKNNLPEKYLFWTGNPSRTVSCLIERLKPIMSIYDNAMRYEELPGAPEYIRRHEDELLQKCDVVVTDNMVKYHEFIKKHPRVLREPQGVDLSLFDRNQSFSTPEPVQGIGHPLIGYYGSLQDVFDYELMEKVMEMRPNYTFIAIGPARNESNLKRLTQHTNFVYVPPVQQRELPKFLRHFDVALIPYQVTDYTAGTFPTKLFEYLSFLKPVVSEPLPEVVQYERYVYLAQTPNDFAAAIDAAIARGAKDIKSLENFVKENSWDERFRHIMNAIHEYSS